MNSAVNVQCGVILISTGKFDLLNHLRNRIRSRINIEELYFKKYDEEIIFKILKARVKSAFSKYVSDKALRLIVEYSEEKRGNMKIAFNLLLNAGEIAQWEWLNRVEEFHAKEVISRLERVIINDKLREMERKRKNELKVLKCIAELSKKQKVDAGSLVDFLKLKKIRFSRRSLANYINYLEREGLIETRFIKKGRRRSREIKLKIEKNLLF